MEVQPDFKELLELFNANKVEYLVIGGLALAFHGAPRYTGDLDLWVRPNEANARRIMTSLEMFGFGNVGVSAEDFHLPGRVVQLGFPPVRIDLATSIDGVSWEQAQAGKVAGEFGCVPVWFLGREEFIANKAAVGRKKDLADIEALQRRHGSAE